MDDATGNQIIDLLQEIATGDGVADRNEHVVFEAELASCDHRLQKQHHIALHENAAEHF
ncbi:hypothetical protein D3C71_1690340 [compost metagenome]